MATDPGPHDARAIAAEAFVFGYPLVLMDVSRQVFLNRPNADGGHDRVNEVAHLRAFPDASFKAVVSPNADTLYSTAWLDLRTEPMVLSQPDSGGRYHLLPILSAWTDVFTAPGTRTTGDGPASFAIVGPRWAGTLPVGVEEVHSPTAMAWLIGRTQTNGAADYDAVHRFQDELAITPLSGWGWAPEARADVPLDPSVDVETPPPDQVAAMDAATFFGRLAGLMVDNPPSAADAPMLEQLATIGLAPGRYEPNPADAAALDDGVRLGLAEIREQLAAAARLPTGWSMARGLGDYGTDYVKRAATALFGLGANLDADAVYPNTRADAEGQPLDGANRYVLHFADGGLPPARAFWSLTMYDEHQYFVDNPIGRYAIGDRDPLVLNADRSLDLRIQHDPPAAHRVPNWLPAPAGPFGLILRIYWPGPELTEGDWSPPGVRRLPDEE